MRGPDLGSAFLHQKANEAGRVVVISEELSSPQAQVYPRWIHVHLADELPQCLYG